MTNNNFKHYLHAFMDNKRWDHYQPRENDIVIATPFKSGTTWMQMIVLNLIYKNEEAPLLREVDHWIDLRLIPLSVMLERLNNNIRRRFIKTHLPENALPRYKMVKYIIVDRDPRDVFMSLWNHYRNLNVASVNESLPDEIPPIPDCPENIIECWNNWLRGLKSNGTKTYAKLL